MNQERAAHRPQHRVSHWDGKSPPTAGPREERRGTDDAGERLATCPRKEGEELRVSLREFKGVRFVDLHLWWLSDTGEWRPSPKGIAIRLRELASVIEALEKARSSSGGDAR